MSSSTTLQASSSSSSSPAFLEWRSRLRDLLIHRKDEESFLDDLCFSAKCAVSDPIPNMPPLLPCVTITNVGRMALPLCDEQANNLKKMYEPLGSDANCWELDSSSVTIGEGPNNKWLEFLDSITRTATGRMGLEPETLTKWGIKPVFDKLLIHEVGGAARPWETSTTTGDDDNSVIGTLLIQLPSKFHGGGMTFSYEFPTIPLEDTIEINLSVESDETFFYSAFYHSYSQHELLPIVWGRRLCLLYKLKCTKTPVDHDEDVFLVDKWMAQNTRGVCELPLRQVVQQWDTACPHVAQACLLKGHYTEDTLSFQNLNTDDTDTVRLLKETVDSSGTPLLNVALLLMYKHEFLFNSKENQFGCKLWVTCEGERITENSKMIGLQWLSDAVLQVTGKTDLDHAAFWVDSEKTERHYSGTTLSQYSGQATTYYRSMVVFWPSCKDIEVASLVSFPLALSALARAAKQRHVIAKAGLVLDLAERTNAFSAKERQGWTHPATEALTVLTSFGTDAAAHLVARTIRLVTKTCRLQHKGVNNAVLASAGSMCSEQVDQAVMDLIRAGAPDCGRIDWSKLLTKQRDGKDRHEIFSNVYMLASLANAEKVMAKEEVAVRFLEFVSGNSELFPKAVDAVLKHGNSTLLSKIVESLLWQGTDCPAMTRLCSERFKQVCQELDNGGPTFSWHQRRATFPPYEEHAKSVLTFLHGPEECTYIHGFKDPKDARVWGQLHFGGNLKDRMRLYHFSVEFEPFEFDDGRSVVILTKTKEVCLKDLKRKKKELQEERTRLQKVLHLDQKTEPPEKRQRHWFDQVVPDNSLW